MVDVKNSQDLRRRGRASTADLQHLRYAVAAADCGSFRRAADGLLVRQSTLSRSIRQLEHSIGMIVFERSSGGVRATSAGRDFLSTARSILEQMDALVLGAHSTGRGEAGRLTLGFYASLSAGNLRATIQDYAQRFPKIEISMIESARTHLMTAVRNGAMDVAIVTGETPLLDGKVVPLWSERIVVAVPEGHRLSASERVCWADLKAETLLMSRHDPGPEIEDLLVAKLVLPEDRPKLIRHDVSREVIEGLVGAGFGVTLLTEASLGASFVGVAYREIRDGAGPARIGYSANWREDNNNPVLASFLKLLGERYPFPTVGV